MQVKDHVNSIYHQLVSERTTDILIPHLILQICKIHRQMDTFGKTNQKQHIAHVYDSSNMHKTLISDTCQSTLDSPSDW